MGVPEQTQLTENKKADIIITTINNYYGIDCRENTRKRCYCQPRQMAQHLIYWNTKLTNRINGSLFNRDHACVNNSLKAVSNLYDTDKDFKMQYDEIERLILNKISKKDRKHFVLTEISNILAKEETKTLEKIMNDYKFKKLLYYKTPEVDLQENSVTLSVDYLDCTLYAFLNIDTKELTVEYIDNNDETVSETEYQKGLVKEHLYEYYASEKDNVNEGFTQDDYQHFTSLIHG